MHDPAMDRVDGKRLQVGIDTHPEAFRTGTEPGVGVGDGQRLVSLAVRGQEKRTEQYRDSAGMPAVQAAEPAPQAAAGVPEVKLQQHDRHQDRRPDPEPGESHPEREYGGIGLARIKRHRGDDADELARFVEAMDHAVDARDDGRRAVEHGGLVEVVDSRHVIPYRKSPQSGDIPDYAEVDGRLAQPAVKVFHDENAFAGERDILAKLPALSLLRYVDLEVRLQVADVDDAKIFLENNAAVGEGVPFADAEAERHAADCKSYAHSPYSSQARLVRSAFALDAIDEVTKTWRQSGLPGIE